MARFQSLLGRWLTPFKPSQSHSVRDLPLRIKAASVSTLPGAERLRAQGNLQSLASLAMPPTAGLPFRSSPPLVFSLPVDLKALEAGWRVPTRLDAPPVTGKRYPPATD